MCERVPANVVLLQSVEVDSVVWRRLVAGEWPKKRNIIIETTAGDVETGQELLGTLKGSIPT